jgi:hypothetical protein
MLGFNHLIRIGSRVEHNGHVPIWYKSYTGQVILIESYQKGKQYIL